MSTDWVDLARRWVPRDLRYAIQRHVSFSEVKRRYFARCDPLSEVTESDINRYGSPVKVGILKSRVQRHTHYVRACQEMGVPFKVIDIAHPNWLEYVIDSGCQLFLVWPDASLGPYARLFKDRCKLLEHDLGLAVFPSFVESWMYEDKIRTCDWLRAHHIPHPRTWVFFEVHQAKDFARQCALPIVFKTRFGAAATGVQIIRTRWALQRIVERAFGSGHVPSGHDKRDREWGSLLLQEYLPEIREWRMVRIGDSYFGHRKGRAGDFHSGSGQVDWEPPRRRQLEMLHHITEAAGFRSMDVDIFETADGTLLVNELQTVFGASVSIDQLRLDGTPGRMARDPEGEWHFDPGDFARNACANERLRYALEHFSHERIC
ncbi:ATP-grasp domain-containing protein [Litchfieldella rifensis]|uniref:RimK family alpha-L-glutamate ligase n=1 Tax=Litchfieldella rifensis TaxID=762643 RepID=A0ABV7LTV1_9GAMM